MTVRGENYVEVLDARDFAEKTRITVPNGPGMTIFSPDGQYGYVCSSFVPETVVIAVADHRIVGKVVQASPFCPNIAATPDGKQVWLTLKDTGKTEVFDYVTVGGLNEVKVFRTETFEQVATIPVGDLPHGIWPSGDGTHVYVGLENADKVVAIDTLTNQVIAQSPLGQGPQALVYVSHATPDGNAPNLQPLGLAGMAVHLSLAPPGEDHARPPTSVTGLAPTQTYVLAIGSRPDGSGALQSLASFTTNSAGAAIVNAVGPIRQIVEGNDDAPRRYLVITSTNPGAQPVQLQIQSPQVR